MTEKAVRNVKIANELYNRGYNCCQSVVSAFAADFKMNKDFGISIGRAFSAGMNYQGKTCGAVLGAYIVLSLYIDNILDKDLSDDLIYYQIKEFNNQFVKKFKSTECATLLGKNPGNESDLIQILENDIFKKKCPAFIEEACVIIKKIRKEKKNE